MGVIINMDKDRSGHSGKEEAIRDARARLALAERDLAEQQRYVDALRNFLRQLTGEDEAPHSLPYVNMKIHKAIAKLVAGEGKTEEEIIEAMISGGAAIGKVNPRGQIKKSIDTNIKVGRLKRDDKGLICRGPKG